MSDLARSFFALPIPAEQRQALIEVRDRLGRDNAGRLPLRLARTEQLHITLKFLGDVSRAVFPQLCAIASARAACCPPLELACEKLVAFGGPRRARALVVEIAAHPALSELSSALEAECEKLGIAREQRAYRPHVTLARLKRPSNAQALLQAAQFEPLRLTLSELRLYESALGPEGGVYSVVESTQLCGE